MQQATINLPSANPVRALQGLARQIALPGEFAPERFPSFPALERTAVMGFMQPATVSVPAAGSCHGFLARQAAYPFWFQQTTASGQTWGATWKSDNINTVATTTSAVNSLRGVEIYAQHNGNTAVSNSNFGVVGGATTLSYAPIAVDNGCGPTQFVYVPDSFRMVVLVGLTSAFGSAANVTVTVEKWYQPGETTITQIAGMTIAVNDKGAGLDMGQVGAGWYRPVNVSWTESISGFPASIEVGLFAVAGTVAVGTSTVNYPTISITGAIGYSLLPGIVPQEFVNSNLPWSSTRVTAVGLLLTNVTQVLNKGGTFLAGRLSPAIMDPFNVAAKDLQGLHPAEKAWLPMETGLYTYCPPSSDMSAFWDYNYVVQRTYPGNVAANIPLYRLDNDSLVNHFYASGSSSAENFAASCAWHFEFRTSSALFQIALSGLSLETLHTAQLALAAAGFFFENPEHDSVLNKVIAGVRKVAPQLVTAVGKVHPMAGHIIKFAQAINEGKKKVNLPQQKAKMKPTSGAASGIVADRKPGGKKGKQSRGKKK